MATGHHPRLTSPHSREHPGFGLTQASRAPPRSGQDLRGPLRPLTDVCPESRAMRALMSCQTAPGEQNPMTPGTRHRIVWPY